MVIVASNTNTTINAFLAQLPSTVSLEQWGEVYCVQPQTMEALQAVLTLLAQPAFASIQIVQTPIEIACLKPASRLWLDTTVATASLFIHKPQDFVVTVGTGIPLEAVENRLRQTNQTLAFTPANGNGSVTIGQVLADNTLPLEANIRRSTLNELVLGCSAFSPTTGEPVAFGGEVVKNVTGYDVQKFLVGHQYALGVVSSVTLRTTPLLPIKGCFQGVFSTEFDLFACLERCLLQPSLWMTQLLVKPHPTGFSLSVGVEAPSMLLLKAWQAVYFPNSQFEAEIRGLQVTKVQPLLVLEMALPLGKTYWQQILRQLLPLLACDEWHWLPACGVLHGVYHHHQTIPTFVLLEQVTQQVNTTLAGSFRLVYAELSLTALAVEIYRLQWAAMPTALQHHHHRLKQTLDPNAQFYSWFSTPSGAIATRGDVE